MALACSSGMATAIAAAAAGRRGSAGCDGAGLDPTDGLGGASTSSGDETSTDCKDSAYVSSERLMDTSPPVAQSWPQYPVGSEVVFDRLTELAIIATSPESPLLRDSPPPTLPPSSSPSSSSAVGAVVPAAVPPWAAALVQPVGAALVRAATPAPSAGHAVSHYPTPGSAGAPYNTQPMGVSDDGPLTPRLLPLTPEDRSAAYTLSTMAKHCLPAPAPAAEPPPTSAQCSPSKKSVNTRTRHTSCPDPAKPRRPMNGFMLFAQKHRGEYSHLHPGKDNRAISVMLGDQWRKMKSEEKKMYSQEAKVRADEVKKVHPDCWKRKRSYSTSI
ncbi:hypothetical protein HPB48_022951 [Haemaphysalis longicornis]|uniref:HMG box domain-containing protein n=1 Tax=Haemaphysalis longicornis TaxID=44386 RepID=A0A9J6FN24_HAELO|nr:hypothetical protein HPB48_022951 [Haemaphysalis longicornis]